MFKNIALLALLFAPAVLTQRTIQVEVEETKITRQSEPILTADTEA